MRLFSASSFTISLPQSASDAASFSSCEISASSSTASFLPDSIPRSSFAASFFKVSSCFCFSVILTCSSSSASAAAACFTSPSICSPDVYKRQVQCVLEYNIYTGWFHYLLNQFFTSHRYLTVNTQIIYRSTHYNDFPRSSRRNNIDHLFF